MTRPRRRVATLALVAVLAALTLADSAAAGINVPGPIDVPTPGDLLPDVGGGIEDLLAKALSSLLRALFGIDADVGRRALRWLIAHPVYTDRGAYPDLNELRGYMTAGGWALLSLVFTLAAFRYWAAGFSGDGSFEAVEAFTRCTAAACGLVALPAVFGYVSVAGNMLTSALLAAPGVEEGMRDLLSGALVFKVSDLGPGVLAEVVAVIVLLLLVVTKILLATLLAVLYVSGPFAIALWPLTETSWLARMWMQGLLGVLIWPAVWAVCFAVFAVMGGSVFSLEGSFGTELIKPWVTVAALYVAFKLPMVVVRQSLIAAASPAWGRAARSGYFAARVTGVTGPAARTAGAAKTLPVAAGRAAA